MKKVLVFLLVVFVCFSSLSIISFAEEREQLIFSMSGADFYNTYRNDPSLASCSLDDNGRCSLTTVNNNLFYKTFLDFDPHIKKRFHFSTSSRFLITFRIVNSYDNDGNPLSYSWSQSYYGDYDIELENCVGFSFMLNIGASGGYNYFSAFNIYSIPDVQGDSSDFGTFIIPFASQIAVQTWDCFSACWWVLAFLLIPLIYIIVVFVLRLFRPISFRRTKYKNNSFKSRFKRKDNVNPKTKLKGSNDKVSKSRDVVSIDGLKYSISNIKKNKLKNCR